MHAGLRCDEMHRWGVRLVVSMDLLRLGWGGFRLLVLWRGVHGEACLSGEGSQWRLDLVIVVVCAFKAKDLLIWWLDYSLWLTSFTTRWWVLANSSSTFSLCHADSPVPAIFILMAWLCFKWLLFMSWCKSTLVLLERWIQLVTKSMFSNWAKLRAFQMLCIFQFLTI